jgi:DNA repair photolyase
MSKIYEPQGKAREYSPLALNIYKGCTHGCKYCYVPDMFRRFRPGYRHEECEPCLNVKELERSCAKWKDSGKRVLLSFTGDPYCGIAPETTTKALTILRDNGIPTAVLSKGGTRMLNDLELFKTFAEIRLGVSLIFYNDNDSLEWEPGAALPSERIATLRELKRNGLTTWASFEPVIDPAQSIRMLVEASPYLDYVKIGKLNHHREIESRIDWTKFLWSVVEICERENLPYYIKNDLAAAAPSIRVRESARIADNF